MDQTNQKKVRVKSSEGIVQGDLKSQSGEGIVQGDLISHTSGVDIKRRFNISHQWRGYQKEI